MFDSIFYLMLVLSMTNRTFNEYLIIATATFNIQ